MAPRDSKAWRELADSITAQVSDAVRQSRQRQYGGSPPSNYRERPPSGGTYRGRAGDASSPYLSWDQPAHPPEPQRGGSQSRPRISSSDLSGELRGLLAETVGATTANLKERRENKARTEPLRRARRRSLRERTLVGAFGILTVAAGASAATQFAHGPQPVAIVESVAAVGAAGMTVRSGVRARRQGKLVAHYEAALTPPMTRAAVPVAAKPLPPASSAAYDPLRRLYAQQAVLNQMLPEIHSLAPDVEPIATESEKSLAQLSTRIVLLENAIAAAGDSAAPEADFGGLRTSASRMVDRLNDGVAAHERLIASAASVIAEMTTPTPGPTPITHLREAADGLQSLAFGLREVRPAPEPGV